MVLYNSYAAFLTSFLAVREVNLPFQTIEEMYHKTDFKVRHWIAYKLAIEFLKKVGFYQVFQIIQIVFETLESSNFGQRIRFLMFLNFIENMNFFEFLFSFWKFSDGFFGKKLSFYKKK